MENPRHLLFILMVFLASMLYFKWLEFSAPKPNTAQVATSNQVPTAVPIEKQNLANTSELPQISQPVAGATPSAIPTVTENRPSAELITVTTDIVVAKINPQGGVIESLELRKEPISLDKPDQGFPLLTNDPSHRLVAQDGLISSTHPTAPNHVKTAYQVAQQNYELGDADQVVVPLTWVSADGVQYFKTYTFKRDNYAIDIEYKVQNNSAKPWSGTLYGQFLSTEKKSKASGFGQLPSYTGAAVYTEQDKYQKISFDDMREEKFEAHTTDGWVAMLQHYFVAAWIPHQQSAEGQQVKKTLYSATNQQQVPASYRIGYRPDQATQIASQQSGSLKTSVYLGSKEQKRLKRLEKQEGVKGISLTVDYGFLTFIADPLFVALSWIHKIVGNWGWAIIILTILIKLVFFPLSAASGKSLAGMKKLQPRLKTLKERYKDDRQKFQTEMMALYKKEKINPAGGCLPILVQIPVFIALYWVLLESVEMRQAPFALWLQDLSAPDPYYVLPVLMGASMWLMQKLNPAPMEEIQKKVMMIMPIALTFLFLTFPQGLVLYWVVNNVLSIVQQWVINKRYAE